MPEEQIEGVKVNVTGDKNWTMDYRESDVGQLFRDYSRRKGSAPKNWQDLMQFDEAEGAGEWHITPGEAVALKQDMEEAMKHNAPFSDDPNKVFQEMHQYRHLHPNMPDEAQKELYAQHHQGHPDRASGSSGNQ